MVGPCLHTQSIHWKHHTWFNRCNRINGYIFTLSSHNLCCSRESNVFVVLQYCLIHHLVLFCIHISLHSQLPLSLSLFLSLSLSLSLSLYIYIYVGLNFVYVLAHVEKTDLASTKTEVIWQINGPYRQLRCSPTNTVGTAPMFLHSEHTRRLLSAGQDRLFADENWRKERWTCPGVI